VDIERKSYGDGADKKSGITGRMNAFGLTTFPRIVEPAC
jgi:hypothetical protein